MIENPVARRVPLPGMAMRMTRDGIPVVRLHYSANPRCSPEWAAKERKKYTSQAWWNLEMEIAYEAMSGQRVYPEFDPELHVIPASRIPRRLCRFMALDPHPRTPTAGLYIGIDAWSDWYAYREIWPSVVYGQPRHVRDDDEEHHYTVREYAETLVAMEGNSLRYQHAEEDEEWAEYIPSVPNVCPRCHLPVACDPGKCQDHRGPERIIERYMDQAGKGFIASGEHQREETYADRYYRYGMQFSDPVKSQKSGEDAIHALLKNRRHEVYGDWPRLHVSDDCPELILEFIKLRYQKMAKPSEEKELKQDPVELRRHLIDCLRYLSMARLSYVSDLVS